MHEQSLSELLHALCNSVIILNHRIVCGWVWVWDLSAIWLSEIGGGFQAKGVGSLMLKWGYCTIHCKNIYHMFQGITPPPFFL